MATTHRTRDDVPTNGQDDGRAADRGVQALSASMGAVGQELWHRAPEMATSSRDVLEGAANRMRNGSDDAVRVGGTFSVGLAIGLFIAGAPRLLVILALGPALAAAGTLLDRSNTRPDLGL